MAQEKWLPRRMFDLHYAQPAAGKSVGIAKLIEQMHRETGKRARVIVGDGSLAAYEYLIDAGIMDYVEFGSRPWPFDVMQRLLGGYLPEHQDDIESPLLPPTPEQVLSLGFTVVEGVSVASNYLMGGIKGGLSWQSGQGIKIGQDSPFIVFQGIKDEKTGKLTDGPGTSVGGNPMSHFGVGQRNIVDLIQLSKSLPGHVIWTAHEYTNDPDKDKLVKELVIGPEATGKALTASLQRLFGNTLHLQTVAKRVKADTKDEFTGQLGMELDVEYRAYTRTHFSNNGAQVAKYLARTINVGNDFPQWFTADEPGMQTVAYYKALAEHRKMQAAGVLGITMEG